MTLRAEPREADLSLVSEVQSSPPAAQSDPERSPAAANEQRPFQDVPIWIWKLFFASWLALFATFAMIFAVSSEVWFTLGVIAAFATVFFVTPLVLLRMSRRTKVANRRRHIGLSEGQCSDVEAATQIVLLPIALAVGLIVIGMFVPR